MVEVWRSTAEGGTKTLSGAPRVYALDHLTVTSASLSVRISGLPQGFFEFTVSAVSRNGKGSATPRTPELPINSEPAEAAGQVVEWRVLTAGAAQCVPSCLLTRSRLLTLPLPAGLSPLLVFKPAITEAIGSATGAGVALKFLQPTSPQGKSARLDRGIAKHGTLGTPGSGAERACFSSSSPPLHASHPPCRHGVRGPGLVLLCV